MGGLLFMPEKEIAVPPVPNMTESQKIFSSIIQNQISLNTTMENLQEKVERHHKVLIEGNGDIPLVEQVRNHGSFITEARHWMRFIGGALIIQTLAFVASVIVAVVRFLPILERLAANP